MIRQVQLEHKKWSRYNFGKVSIEDSFLGIVEEVGELSHAILKERQGIRVNEDHVNNMKDSIGDILIYMISFCSGMNWDIQDILLDTWISVKQRDWKKYPNNGRTK